MVEVVISDSREVVISGFREVVIVNCQAVAKKDGGWRSYFVERSLHITSVMWSDANHVLTLGVKDVRYPITTQHIRNLFYFD